MSVPPPSNVKVYDRRPERKAPAPIVIIVVLLVVAIVGFFLYRAMHHEAPTSPANARPGIILSVNLVRTEICSEATLYQALSEPAVGLGPMACHTT